MRLGWLLTAAVLCMVLLIITPQQASAGIAFQGLFNPVIFIPPVNPPASLPTFTVGSPPFLTSLVNACVAQGGRPNTCVFPWRIRNSGDPFWPVPNGIPLIRDTTLSNTPVVAPAGVWGIWDPPTEIVADQTIRVFELFTGIDQNAPSLGTIYLLSLQSVEGYPGLTVGSFPSMVNIPQPVGLNPSVDIISNTIAGLVTGTVYPTFLVESSFATLDADIAALAPGTTDPYDTFFQGASGRVVISYADVPEKDVIGFAEQVPEPAPWPTIMAGLAIFLGYRWRLR